MAQSVILLTSLLSWSFSVHLQITLDIGLRWRLWLHKAAEKTRSILPENRFISKIDNIYIESSLIFLSGIFAVILLRPAQALLHDYDVDHVGVLFFFIIAGFAINIIYRWARNAIRGKASDQEIGAVSSEQSGGSVSMFAANIFLIVSFLVDVVQVIFLQSLASDILYPSRNLSPSYDMAFSQALVIIFWLVLPLAVIGIAIFALLHGLGLRAICTTSFLSRAGLQLAVGISSGFIMTSLIRISPFSFYGIGGRVVLGNFIILMIVFFALSILGCIASAIIYTSAWYSLHWRLAARSLRYVFALWVFIFICQFVYFIRVVNVI
jgi:hypothetical protein